MIGHVSLRLRFLPVSPARNWLLAIRANACQAWRHCWTIIGRIRGSPSTAIHDRRHHREHRRLAGQVPELRGVVVLGQVLDGRRSGGGDARLPRPHIVRDRLPRHRQVGGEERRLVADRRLVAARDRLVDQRVGPRVAVVTDLTAPAGVQEPELGGVGGVGSPGNRVCPVCREPSHGTQGVAGLASEHVPRAYMLRACGPVRR